MSLDMTGGRKVEAVDVAVRPTKAKKQPSQGQTGPKISLTWDGLSTNEKRVLKAMLPAPGEHRKTMTIADIVTATGWAKRVSQKKANSMVRNQLRRLVRADLVEHENRIKDGRYILTDPGKRLAKAHLEPKKPEQAMQPNLTAEQPQETARVTF